MRSVLYNNSTIFYRVSGLGNPVIFLHGFLENHSIWNTIATEIETLGFKVVLIDLPCHGKSRFDGSICSMQFMAKAVQKIMAEEKISNPFIFGHSLGGYVALEIAKLKSSDFFIQICGGHPYFNENQGKPMLSKRHAPFKITAKGRVVWLSLYQQLLPKLNISEELIISYWNYLNIFSVWMINSDDDGL